MSFNVWLVLTLSAHELSAKTRNGHLDRAGPWPIGEIIVPQASPLRNEVSLLY
jgi:hypothetical protein